MTRESPQPHGPLLSPSDEPPGQFVAGKWEGALDWCTQHGPAIVQWSIGVSTYVWNARAENGRRVNLQGRQPASDLFRADTTGPSVLGRISIKSDDVEFSVVDEDPNPDVDETVLPLLTLLRADAAFMADLSSPAFAGALYAAIENEEFVADGAVFEFGQRSAALFVAVLRNVGEDYLDFAWGRGPDFARADADRVRGHFARLGVAPRGLV